MTAVVDEAAGRLALTRVQLGALADLAAGRDVPAGAVRDLDAAGALDQGEPHPMLWPVLRTLATVHGWVRTYCGPESRRRCPRSRA